MAYLYLDECAPRLLELDQWGNEESDRLDLTAPVPKGQQPSGIMWDNNVPWDNGVAWL